MTKPESHPLTRHTSVDVLADVGKSSERAKDVKGKKGARSRRLSVLFAIVSIPTLILNAGVVRADETVDSQVIVEGPWDVDGLLQVDDNLYIQNGGAVTSEEGWIGVLELGLVQVVGAGSTWTNGELSVGLANFGVLDIADGGTVYSDDITVGGYFFGPGLGDLTVRGDGSALINNGNLYIGAGGNGGLGVSDGATVTSQSGFIGYSDAGNPGDDSDYAKISGGGSWILSDSLLIGNARNGTLEIHTGGTVSTTAGSTELGVFAGAHGTLLLTGRDGERGVLETGQLAKGGGTADVTFAGGILRATRDEADFLSGFNPGDVILDVGGNLENGGEIIDTGGAYFDTNGYDIGVAAPLGGNAWLVKQGAGTLTLTGANDYSGGTIIEAGVLSIGADENLGDAAGDLTLDGGTLQTTADFTTSRATTLDANGGTFLTDDETALIHNGVISGSGDLTKQSTGTLTLSGANTYTGGTIIDEGTLSIEADGNLGDATGDLTLDGGTLQTTADFTTSRATTLGAGGGTFQTDNATTLIHEGTITGTGALTKHGAGTLVLSDDTNSYSGGTIIDEGILRIAADENLGDATGDLTLDGGTLQTTADFTTSRSTTLGAGGGTFLTDNATTLTHDGPISGTGALTKNGAGTLVLSDGTNGYSGGTIIYEGILSIAADENLGDATGDLTFDGGTLQTTANFTTNRATTLGAGGGTFLTDNATTLTHGGAITGIGALTKDGIGTLTLTGDNTYSGGTTIANGILQIGNGGTSGSITGDVTNDAALVFDRSDALTFGGDISGTGSLTQQGGGTLTLTGTNTYSGGTTINAGTLDVDGGSISHGGSDFTIGEQAEDTGAVTITNGGAVTSRFVYVGDAAGSNGAVTVAGAGSIWTSGTNFQVGRGGSGTLTAADGGIVATLTGSYSSVRLGTSSGASGTLNIGDGGAAGVVNASQVWGGDGTATLNFNHTDADYLFTKNGAATGGLVDIRGSTTVNHIGAGTTTLTGIGSYTGATTVEAGTLRAGSAAAFAADGAYTINGGTLDLNDHDLTMSALDGTGGAVALGGAALTVDQANDTTYAGAIAGGGGLAKTGAGTLELTGDSSGFAGQMDLNHGVLLINGQLGGAAQVNDGGTLAGSGTVGDLTVASGGTLAPGNSIGTLTVDGDLTLDAGAITAFELGSPGTAANPASGTSDRIDVTGDLAFGGTVNLTQSDDPNDGTAGLGYYRLMTYGGDLTSNAATLGTTPSLADAGLYELQAGDGRVDLFIAALGDATLQHWQGGDGSWDTTQTQWLNQDGETPTAWGGQHAIFKDAGSSNGGTIAVEGAQSFESVQFVDEGYLLTGAGQLLTDPAGSEIRVLANHASIATEITGSGGITKTEAGTLTLTGSNSYTGDTIVNAGTLVVATEGFVAGDASINGGHFDIDGEIAGLVTVNAGGSLGGSGTLGELRIDSGGYVAPGNSIGTLNVAGDYTLGSGATYEVELIGGGNTPGIHNDLIAVAGAATLEEGSLIHVTPENGSDDGASGYADGSTYTILTTGGGLTVAGAGPDINDDYAYLDFAGSADADNYYLTASLLGGATSFCLPGQSGNQCATGDGAYSVGADNPVYDALLNMSAEQAAVALNQLSGENHASTQSALLTGPDLLRSNVLARMRRADDFTRDNAYQDNVTPGATAFGMSRTDSADPVWMNVIGGTASLDGNNNAADLDSRDWGFLTGTDGNPDWLDGDWRLGFLAGYTNTHFSIDERSASGESDNLHLGLYGGRQWGPLALRIAATQSWHWIDTERNALAGELSGDTNGRTFQSFGELGYAFSAGDASIEPFINAAYVHQRINSFNERGSFALSVDESSKDIGFSTLGLRASTLLSLGESPLALHGSLGWRHTVGDIRPESSNAFVGGTPFTVSGTAIARDVAVIEAGFDLLLSDTATLGIGYDGQYADDTLVHSGRLQFTVKF